MDLCDFFRDVSCFYPFITAMIAGTGKKSIQRQTNVTVSKDENTGKPSEDRMGCGIETPDEGVILLSVNGPTTDEELFEVIESLELAN